MNPYNNNSLSQPSDATSLFSQEDLASLVLSFELAAATTLCLLLICIPLALWTAFKPNLLSKIIYTLSALPLVLPPTVIGFYCLLLLSPNSTFSQLTNSLGITPLAFSFTGIVLASCIYSLPFVLQPIHNAFANISRTDIEAAKTLQASRIDIIFSIILPQSKPGLLTAAILGFAHTLGEFGVILMVGGNIPEETKVASIQIYEHVESLNFEQAHVLSLTLLSLAFLTLIAVQLIASKTNVRREQGENHE